MKDRNHSTRDKRIPLQLLLNRLFHFNGLIWAQPITEIIMMAASVRLLRGTILTA